MDNDLQRLADLLGDILEKYADKIDLDSLPDPPPSPSKEKPATDQRLLVFA